MLLANTTISYSALFYLHSAPLHGARTGFRGWQMIIMAVIIGGLLWLTLYFVDQYRQLLAAQKKTPQSLFRELCRLHHLSSVERQFLLQVQTNSRPEHLSVIFVDPQILASSSEFAPQQGELIRSLQLKLFGEVS